MGAGQCYPVSNTGALRGSCLLFLNVFFDVCEGCLADVEGHAVAQPDLLVEVGGLSIEEDTRLECLETQFFVHHGDLCLDGGEFAADVPRQLQAALY